MAISVIISNLNGARFLPRLLATLNAQRGVTTEIIVVDRNSTDDSPAILATHPEVKVIYEAPQTGLVFGYAAGVPHAKHEHLFFCNEDMWFDDTCLAELEEQIDLSANVVAADPWQWSYDGKVWIHGGTRFRPARWAINGVHPRRHFDFTVKLMKGAVVPFPCAGAFMMDRSIYNKLGGWDTSLFLDNEDVDLFIRAWQRGWKCVTVPAARVYHAVGMSNPETPESKGTGKPTPGAGRRRYISNRVGKCLLPLKYFSTRKLWIGGGNFLVMLVNNLCKLRFRLVQWDLVVFRELAMRMSAIIAVRRANRSWNREKPGECFFVDPQFQQGVPRLFG